jgi:SAM-dependent methyltransferase
MSPKLGIAPDGSPVALYSRLPALGEPELIHDAVPAGAEILELTAGAGRVTHGLLALGHPVVAVDESAEMLELIDGAETVQADIATLSLGRSFPVVVLGSNFINEPEQDGRRAFLRACARHVAAAGRVLLEGFPRDWEPSFEWSEHGDVRFRLRSASRDGSRFDGVMEYIVDGEPYVHAFRSKLLSDKELEDDLRSVGLTRTRWLDERGSWVEAVPAAW